MSRQTGSGRELPRWWMVRRRFPDVNPTVAALVAIVVIALLATGIGWLVYRS